MLRQRGYPASNDHRTCAITLKAVEEALVLQVMLAHGHHPARRVGSKVWFADRCTDRLVTSIPRLPSYLFENTLLSLSLSLASSFTLFLTVDDHFHPTSEILNTSECEHSDSNVHQVFDSDWCISMVRASQQRAAG